MSVLLMAQAWQVKLANASRKLVLVKLADNANDEGVCWPSYAYLADQCEMSERTVIRHIKDLVLTGFVEKKTRYGGALFNKTNLYKLTLSKGDISSLKTLQIKEKNSLKNVTKTDENRGDNLSLRKETEVTMTTVRGDNDGKFGVTETASRSDTGSPRTINEPSIEPSIEPLPKKRSKKPKYIQEIFDLYPAHRRGGTTAQFWKIWKQEKLTENDAFLILNWLTRASKSDLQWATHANGQFVKGLTKFIRERHWLTPIPIAQQSARPATGANFYSGDTSWAEDLGDL